MAYQCQCLHWWSLCSVQDRLALVWIASISHRKRMRMKDARSCSDGKVQEGIPDSFGLPMWREQWWHGVPISITAHDTWDHELLLLEEVFWGHRRRRLQEEPIGKCWSLKNHEYNWRYGYTLLCWRGSFLGTWRGTYSAATSWGMLDTNDHHGYKISRIFWISYEKRSWRVENALEDESSPSCDDGSEVPEETVSDDTSFFSSSTPDDDFIPIEGLSSLACSDSLPVEELEVLLSRDLFVFFTRVVGWDLLEAPKASASWSILRGRA